SRQCDVLCSWSVSDRRGYHVALHYTGRRKRKPRTRTASDRREFPGGSRARLRSKKNMNDHARINAVRTSGCTEPTDDTPVAYRQDATLSFPFLSSFIDLQWVRR